MQATATIRNNSDIIVDRYDVNPLSHVDTNPLEVRWGFNPVQRDKILDARLCGVAQVPYARFFPIRSFRSPREKHSIDWTMPKEEIETIPAELAQREIEQSLAGKNAQVPQDWGLRIAFVGERDIAKMEVLTQTILPTLTTIREICADRGFISPITDVCEGSDDITGNRETCPTCWNRWVNSSAGQDYFEIVVAEGLPVTERDTQTSEIVQRIVRPTMDEMLNALQLVRESFRVGLATLRDQWEVIVRETEKNERKAPTMFEDLYRRDLHANRPEDRQIAMVEKFAKAQQGGNQGNADLLASLAQSQIQTQALLAAVLQNQQNVPVPAPAAVPSTDEQLNAAFAQKLADGKRKKQEEGKNDEG